LVAAFASKATKKRREKRIRRMKLRFPYPKGLQLGSFFSGTIWKTFSQTLNRDFFMSFFPISREETIEGVTTPDFLAFKN